MNRLITLIIFIALLNLNVFAQNVRITKPNPNDIGYSIYHYTENLIKELHLKELQKGFDSRNIRVWVITGFSFLNEMYEISNKKNVWKATYHPFILYNEEDGKVKLKYKESHTMTFKSSPDSFFQSLLVLGIDTLHTKNTYKLEDVMTDGQIYCFEFANSNNYNFYSSDNIFIQEKKYKQAAICADIMRAMEQEFNIADKRKETLKSWRQENRWKR